MPYKHPRLPAPGGAAPRTPEPGTPELRTAKTRSPRSAKGTLPAFTPVPREYDRCDGWTPERQQGFIEALADLGSVKAAAGQVGMSAEGVYLLRRHPEAGEFRTAWEAALKCGVQRLEDVAMERALNGVEVPVYHFGAVVGTRRVHNDRLLMFLLRNRAPKRFAADSLANGDAATQSQLKRLKREWRAESEAEQRAQQAHDSDAIFASIDAKLDRMRQREIEQRLSERALTRAGRDEGADDALGDAAPRNSAMSDYVWDDEADCTDTDET